MTIDILSYLGSKVLLADGAMGTMLQTAGLAPGEPSESWNLKYPDRVRTVHRAYYDAGARLILTNTFGANPMKLLRSGLAENFQEINQSGVSIAKNSVGPDAIIAGDIGPSGELPEPLGSASIENLKDNFKKQAEVLAKAGADIIIIETMISLEEILCAVSGARSTGLRVIASMSFDPAPSGFRTAMGVSVNDAATALTDAGADVVGTNCGWGIKEAVEIIRQMRQIVTTPLIAKPNAGIPKLVSGKTVYEGTPEEMSRTVPELAKTGANIIGGCCGTTPGHIRAMKKELR